MAKLFHLCRCALGFLLVFLCAFNASRQVVSILFTVLGQNFEAFIIRCGVWNVAEHVDLFFCTARSFFVAVSAFNTERQIGPIFFAFVVKSLVACVVWNRRW